jgi:hypothetical protein
VGNSKEERKESRREIIPKCKFEAKRKDFLSASQEKKQQPLGGLKETLPLGGVRLQLGPEGGRNLCL